MKHKHHIVPRRMGGSNDPSNLIELSIEEHALAHKKLYEKYGKLEDKIAWLCLSGKTEEGERLRKELSKIKFKEFLKDEEKVKSWKEKISNTLTGRLLTEEHKESISTGLLLAYQEGRRQYVKPDIEILRSNCYNNKEKLAEGRRNSETWRQSVQSEEYKKLKRTLSKNRIPITIDGIEYESIRYAAKQLNMPFSRMRDLVAKNGQIFSLE